MEPKNDHTNKPIGLIETQIDGFKLFIDSQDEIMVSTFNEIKDYEIATTKVIKNLVKDKMTVVNIGANIGYFSLLMAKLVGPRGKVISFEPLPKNVELLRKNVEANGFTNVKIVQKAVSNKTGKGNFWLPNTALQSFLSEKGAWRTEKFEVETTTLDDFIENTDEKVDFVMMDAEGSEKIVLEGMANTIKQNADLDIITEYNPHPLKLAGSDAKSLLDTIQKYGFFMFKIDDATQKVEPISRESLEKYQYPDYTNLYLTRKSKPIF